MQNISVYLCIVPDNALSRYFEMPTNYLEPEYHSFLAGELLKWNIKKNSSKKEDKNIFTLLMIVIRECLLKAFKDWIGLLEANKNPATFPEISNICQNLQQINQ